MPERKVGVDETMVTTRQEASAIAIYASGEFDASTAHDLYAALRDAAARGENVTVDCAGVTFMDAGCFGILLAARKRLEAQGCTLTLRNAGRAIVRLAELLHAESLITDST